MTDEVNTSSTYNHGAIMDVDLQREMEKSYLDYAMSVIVGRALPDVRDGMKPVHRRVLYAMYDGGYRPENSFSKSAKVVGDVMGHYHPHGDFAIYDTMARLVQPWSMRYPLVSGQGNFGTPGDLGPAAPRYTEARMAPLAMEMVQAWVDCADSPTFRTRVLDQSRAVQFKDCSPLRHEGCPACGT